MPQLSPNRDTRGLFGGLDFAALFFVVEITNLSAYQSIT